MALCASLPPAPCAVPGQAGPGAALCPAAGPIGHPPVRWVLPGCRGNACQGIDKQQICVSADAFLMACPEVQTLGLYPPACQPSAQQSLLLKQSEGCHRPCFPALLMHLPPTNTDKERQIWGSVCTVGCLGGCAVQTKVQILLSPGTRAQEPSTAVQPSPLITRGAGPGSSALQTS